MSKKINTRKDYRDGLGHIEKILSKYPKVPNIKGLAEESLAWLQKYFRMIGECFKCSKIKHSEELKGFRNLEAHSKDDNEEKSIALMNELFPKLEEIKSEVEQLIGITSSPSKEKRKFENFGSSLLGTEFERKQIVDAQENLFEKHNEDEEIEFPQNKFSDAIKAISKDITENNFDYLLEHEELTENIQTKILNEASKLADSFITENPFLQEESFVEKLKKSSVKEISDTISKIQWHYVRLPTKGANIDFDFYKSRFEELQKKLESSKSNETKLLQTMESQKEIYVRNLINDLQKSLQERKDKWQVQKIDEWRKKLLQELFERIENFKKLEKLLLPFCKETGYLWDLSNSPFKDMGFDVLQNYASLLESDESLQELAKLLGKQNKEIEEYEKELRAKTVVKTEFYPEPAYKGEICGITIGNDISSVLPSELALYKNPATKKLFELRFAQKQLLSFDYITNVAHGLNQTVNEEVNVAKQNEKGPVILCIDTSGSMQGSPERIAKTLTFAITKIARSEDRKCFLISFSTQIQTLDLSGESFSSLENLVQFLRMSFNGGTDTTPALQKSLEMLKTENYKNADVLMISDFIANNLGANIEKNIEEAKECKTKFYSLVIGNSGNSGLINCFNENWFYDLQSKDSMKHIVRSIKSAI